MRDHRNIDLEEAQLIDSTKSMKKRLFVMLQHERQSIRSMLQVDGARTVCIITGGAPGGWHLRPQSIAPNATSIPRSGEFTHLDESFETYRV